MLRNYGELILRLIENLKSGTADVSFMECLQIMGNGIFLASVILIMLAIVAGLFWFPGKGYNLITSGPKDVLNRLLTADEADENAITKAKHSLTFRRGAYFIILTVIYLPVCIPAVLYMLSMLIH